MTTYNGHKNWNYWNVSLWINNDERLYYMARDYVKYYRNKQEAAKAMLARLQSNCGSVSTPDGARYTVSNIRAAMGGM